MAKKLTITDYLRLAAPLSDVDRQIVSMLQADGRQSFAQIARDVGIAEKTVGQRVRHLLDEGVIQITALTDPRVLGYGAAALLGLTTDPKVPASRIAEALKKIPAIDYVIIATGRFALYAEILCSGMSKLQETIEANIGPIVGINSIEVFPYLNLHYQNAHFASARSKSEAHEGIRPRELDQTDKNIVRALSRDGRASFQQIADDLNISETQVRTRVKQLTESRILEVIALINPMGFEYRSMALVALRAAPGHRVAELADALACLPNTTYVAICAGRFDIFTEIICRSEHELLEIIDNEVRSWPSVACAEVSIYIDLHYKRLTPIRDDDAQLLGTARSTER
ncbi:Lrp/AsnC family transcriptional regulator [Hyphomicrobium sp.]|uniref:Lrp/AsnC family transcriptional regulator n=1 Tax=Hyphomicrobium sp. TaxID=82 RepID=UPI001DD6DEE5|nr:Lrp/AsnC family transcriptional regulator [Hyphomicrobium sp.]MBY0558789.1 Lrp/AsnC family transcriptional regulator [Hyphomicrobium sp.]